MELREIAKRCWELLWPSYSRFWPFGLFVSGVGGAASAALPSAGATPGPSPVGIPASLAVAAIAAGLALVANVVSEGALIEGFGIAQQDRRLTFRAGVRAGFARFRAVLLIKLVALAGLTAAAALPALPVVLGVRGVVAPWIAWLVGVVALIIFAVPATLTGYAVYQYALRFAVLEGAPAADAFRAAYRFVHGRVRVSLTLSVLGWIATSVGGVAVSFALLPAAVVAAAFGWAAGLWPAVVVGGLLGAPAAVAVLGAVGAYRSGIWTVGFLRMHGGA